MASAQRKPNQSETNPIIGGATKNAQNEIMVSAATLSADDLPGRLAAAVTAKGSTTATPQPDKAAPSTATGTDGAKANNKMPAAAARPEVRTILYSLNRSASMSPDNLTLAITTEKNA